MTDATTTPVQTASTETTAAATSASSQATGDQTLTTQPSGSATTQGQQSSGSDAWAGLSPENLSIVQNKKWGDLNSFFKSYSDMEKAYGAKTATVDVPADVNGYDWARPADAEQFGYSDDFAGNFKQGMLGAKVPKAAAQAAHDWFVDYAKSAATKQAEARDTDITQSKVTLTREWGPEDGPTFSRNVELATRAVEQLGLGDHLVQSGALMKSADGKYTVVKADAVKAFSKIGQAMFAEDTLYGNLAAASNPFALETENRTLAGRMVKENPQLAKQLIIQSGRQKDFSMTLSKIG